MSRKHSSGKGDTYRKVDYKTYAKNYKFKNKVAFSEIDYSTMD